MERIFLAALAACLCAAAASASEAPGKFLGKYAYKDIDPAKQKCQLVSPALASRLEAGRFSCMTAEAPLGASGLKAIVCSDPGQKTQYLLFDSNKKCENERRNEASNND